MPVLTIVISPEEKQALDELSRRTLRDPRAQAKIIILNALIEQGLLKSEYQQEQGAQNASAR